MSKNEIKNQDPTLPLPYLSSLDFAFGQTYSISQFFTGSLGDSYNRRLVLSISLAIQACLFLTIGVIAKTNQDIESAFGGFITCFALLGLI